MTTRLVIKNGRLIDPASRLDGIYNIYSMGGRVASVKEAAKDATELAESGPGIEIIDAKGLIVTPGFIDAHTHLRDPGFEYKETIETGALAAAAGGFTSILCMANTMPVNDNESVTRYILKKAEGGCGVNVLPVGAVTQGLKGEKLTEIAELKSAGCVAISDDGRPIVDGGVMRRALEYSRIFNLPVISHAEDPAIAGPGVMNEGIVATRLGLRGIPNAAEEAMVARDISLAGLTGGRLHIAHVSAKGSVELVRMAKKRGVRVTAEATPHHLTLTEEAVLGYNTNARMSPPLRTKEDVEALMEGLRDGTIDCIATDHAPHAVTEKDVEFDKAANGIIGLETAFSLIYGLTLDGSLTISQAVSALTASPAKAFGLEKGTLRVGSAADITIIDPDKTWTVEETRLRSRSRNTPFLGVTLKGAVVKTIVGGRVVHSI